MTPTPADVQRLTDADTARALRQNVQFLSLFLEPHSPSEIAASAGMAANLAHHHTRKLAGLGLLLEVGRDGGKVFYQLAAREFRVPLDLLPEGKGTVDIQGLSEGFSRAYERSWTLMHQGEEDVYGFGSGGHPVPLPSPPESPCLEAYPAHLDSLTLRLSSERYQRLVRALSALLTEAYTEGQTPEGKYCTLAVLGFQSEQETGRNHLSRNLNSFLGAD
ncbi:winged helix-turn-helix domain-containing protein [Deinococcus humi]|uniref:DNA-binding transcriptional ArsR family regulator n=1 Tax=Deinococcus humi TaxID=662880 RepID=A0A7W8K1J0_9DEIO|nr:winged helix-turn-helix domain-containing protein [Deinococcus humi]MBB5365771.1 DNA-binding transcriptional ArsR family regulator [Deinococcus humi]GGO41101.1 transcriptional regulator [Deinococcus humi]